MAPVVMDQPALMVVGVYVPDRPEGALGDEFSGFLNGRAVAVAEVYHIDDSRFLGGVAHLQGVGMIESQGLFAEDVFARRDDFEGQGMMKGVGSDDRYGIKVRLRQHLIGIGVDFGNTMFRGEIIHPLGVDVAGRDNFATVDGVESVGVGEGHASGSEYSEFDHSWEKK